jgi:integrating conjugative element protein (TIGR03759 family)
MIARALTAIVLALLVSPSRAADNVSTQVVTTPTIGAQFQVIERTAAARWGLTVEKYRRYQELLQGVTGSLADARISPIEVLGIFARTELERSKYAELFARLSFDYIARALEFEAAYQKAAHRLFPDAKVVEVPAVKTTDPAAKGARH